MRPDVTSKHLRTSTELTLIAPVRQGFIEYVDTVTYASRLRLLLNVLFELRKGADERSSGKTEYAKDQLEYVGPLERLQTLHFVQWAVIDDDTRLLLNVTFDRSWESYIRDIVDVAGPLLDIILCHCADYEGHSTNLGYEKFAEWVRAHQVSNDFLYASEPSLTSDDQRYLKDLAALPSEILKKAPGKPIGEELEKQVRDLRVTIREPSGGTLEDLQRIGGALFDLRRYFAGNTTPMSASFLSASARQELVFYDEVAYLLLAGFDEDLLNTRIESFKLGANVLATWYRDLPRRKRSARADAPKEPLIKKDALSDIQRGLLTPYAMMTHGCLALVQWPTRQKGGEFLAKLLDELSFENKHGDKVLSLALTYRGLKSLDLSEQELRAFPKEFREGMEARSGILGDIKSSHPSAWTMPEANWPAPDEASKESGAKAISLGSVDAVLVLQRCVQGGDDAYEWSREHPLFGELDALQKSTGVRVLHVQALRREYEQGAMLEHFGFRDDVSQPHVAYEGSGERAVLARDEIAPGEIVLGYPNARGETVRWTVSGVPEPEPREDLLRNGSFLVLRKLNQNMLAFDAFLDNGANVLSKALGGKPEATKAALLEQMMGRAHGTSGATTGRSITAAEDAQTLASLQDPKLKQAMQDQIALNSFDFGPESRCPFHAHIRRMNPRDELPGETEKKAAGSNTPQRKTPRILRRSFTYGRVRKPQDKDQKAYEKDGQERGLMFMALNAGIADQYEILQRWISGGNSTGLPSSLADLLSGASNAAVFPVELGGKTHWLDAPEQPLVELQWGMYAFVPSRHAIELLAQRAQVSPEKSVARAAKDRELGLRGVALITKLQALPESIAKVEWKRVLENRDAIEDTRAIWGAVLKVYGGALRTPYGVLIAGSDNVYEVLRNSDTYSVREYWHRMKDSIGVMHLGMDPHPKAMPSSCSTAKDKAYEAAVVAGTYEQLAKTMNEQLYKVTAGESFKLARVATSLALGTLPPNPDTGLLSCDLRDLSAAILQGISAKWFGTPSYPKWDDVSPGQPRPPRSSIADYRQCSAYVFTPNPEPWVAEGARAAINAIEAAYRDEHRAITAATVKLAPDPTVTPESEALATTMKGAAFGFLAATLGSIVSTFYQWVESGELWRLQQSLASLRLEPSDADLEQLRKRILAAMQQGPVPPVLHRQVVQHAQLGAVALVPGDRVVASLATVAADNASKPVPTSDVDVMFGGRYGAEKQPVHACPGREMAIGVMMGMAWALLEQHDIRRVSEVNALKLTLRPSDVVQDLLKANRVNESKAAV